MSEASAKAAMRKLADEAQAVVKTSALTSKQKSAELDRIEVELKKYSDEVSLHTKAKLLAGGGDSGFFTGDHYMQLGVKSVLAASSPSLVPTPEGMDALFKACRDKQSITVKTPVGTGNVDPATYPQQYLPPVLAAREPTRILDRLPTTGAETGIIEYYETTGTAAAAATAEGTLKPQSSIAFTKQTATMTKIAHFVEATEEALTDFQPFSQLLSEDMVAGLIEAENLELLSASGTAPHGFKGLLVVSGTQSYTQAASPETALDAIEKGATLLRAGGRFVTPDGLVMHPDDYSDVRRIKDTAGRYVADQMSFGTGAPLTASDSEPRLWNLPVTLTTQITPKTVLVGNFARAAMVWVREGVNIRTDPYSMATSNIVNVICEERLTLGVVAPAALAVVTLT